MEPGRDTLNCLLAEFPDTVHCEPKEFDFGPHRARGFRPLKEGQRLPHRLLLSAFSDKVGHRSTGLQRAQALLFVERFPTEFTPMAMHQIVLPCSEDFTLPFVTDGGLLPCPCLSTFNALKYLQEKPEKMARMPEPRHRWKRSGRGLRLDGACGHRRAREVA